MKCITYESPPGFSEVEVELLPGQGCLMEQSTCLSTWYNKGIRRPLTQHESNTVLESSAMKCNMGFSVTVQVSDMAGHSIAALTRVPAAAFILTSETCQQSMNRMQQLEAAYV